MNRVEQLAAASRSPVAKFHELRLKYWTDGIEAICCFEGGDDIEFYLPHIENHLKLPTNKLAFVNCGGKGVVLGVWKLFIQSKWNFARVGFFVDRDLDDFINGNPSGEQLYITDYYSIESSAISPRFFDSIWRRSFRLPLDDERYAHWANAFRQGSEDVSKILLPLFSTALSIKRQSGDVDFDKVGMDEFYSVGDGGKVCRNRTRKKGSLARAFRGDLKWSLIRRARRELIETNCHALWLRGKAALAFSMAFFSRMKLELCAKNGNPRRCKVRVNFNGDTALMHLCANSGCCESLEHFLHQWSKLLKKQDNEGRIGT